ncbi:hypothetical protein GW17_00056210 [Ensete ventricosum]|uniref:Uncharacterized protein n=1 Tax=Ensete ventricosum TaxID=4639 RepID=A0A426X3D2_ENSVE|nr:hypothetical protein B296_00053573 [Ensete ventricosum]RWV82298.1 hypothetical protein GW17_00056210 [Ensete ventricosum]
MVVVSSAIQNSTMASKDGRYSAMARLPRGHPTQVIGSWLLTGEACHIKACLRRSICSRGCSTPSQVLPCRCLQASLTLQLGDDVPRLVSAWLQVDQGNTTVTAIFKTAKEGFVQVGAVEARSGCWSMLKGGLTAKSSGPAEFYFEVTSPFSSLHTV